MIHYQFETIHPFLDGNGRIGRLLITLYLIEKKILTTPALYISYFLKKNRIEYYDRMTEVRTKGNYEQWIRFFLQAIAECAEDTIVTIDKLTALHNKNEAAMLQTGRRTCTLPRAYKRRLIHTPYRCRKTVKHTTGQPIQLERTALIYYLMLPCKQGK